MSNYNPITNLFTPIAPIIPLSPAHAVDSFLLNPVTPLTPNQTEPSPSVGQSSQCPVLFQWLLCDPAATVGRSMSSSIPRNPRQLPIPRTNGHQRTTTTTLNTWVRPLCGRRGNF